MKRTLCILLASLLLLSLCACKEAGSSKHLFAFVHSAEESSYFSAVSDSFCAAATELGYECTVVKPENDTAEAQITLIEDMIEQGVKGIALNANQMDGLEAVLKTAKDASIPVVTVGRDTKGSQLYIQPSSQELIGISLMDAIYDLTDGEGTFVVLSGETFFSGMDPLVHDLGLVARDSKYQKLIWAETNYSFDVYHDNTEDMIALITQLLNQHPGLEVICCPGPLALAACCKAVEDMDVAIQVTGMYYKPSEIQELVGEGKPCPYFFTWDSWSVGSCAAYALKSLEDSATLEKGGIFTTQLGGYDLQNGYDDHLQIIAGPPLRYPAPN